MNYLGYLIVAGVLCALPAGGCGSPDADPRARRMDVFFVQPYPLGCHEVKLDIFPTAAEFIDRVSPYECGPTTPMGEAGDAYQAAAFDVTPGEWTVTISLRQGDCVGREDIIKIAGEHVEVWVELSCE